MSTKNKVYDTAESIKPYVDRAMNDERLRKDVMNAFTTAKDLYNDLIGNRDAVMVATRVATDDDIREKLRDAVEDLRDASDRLQGKHMRRRRRKATLLVAGIALGLLLNPVTGPDTRRFIKEMITGDEGESDASSSNGIGSA